MSALSKTKRIGWWLSPLAVAVCLIPLGNIGWDAWYGGLSANPIEDIEHRTGAWTLKILLASLAVTPLRRISGWAWLFPLRRTLGLMALAWASLHFLAYVGLDHFFAWADMAEDVLERRYVTVGFLGLLTPSSLGVTSTQRWQRRLGGKKWQRLHRLAYAAALCGCLHFLWLVKKDISEPLLHLAVLAVLLALRLPIVTQHLPHGRPRAIPGRVPIRRP